MIFKTKAGERNPVDLPNLQRPLPRQCYFQMAIALLLSLLIAACQETTPQAPVATLDYPETRASDHQDRYFEHVVNDPYRWLEDDRSAETKDWVAAQNKTTEQYLDRISYRSELKQRLTKLWSYPRRSAPFKEGDWVYFYQNSGLQNHSILMRRKQDEPPEVFLDPNAFSEDGSVSLSQISFSPSSKFAAYAVSVSGADWRRIHIIDTETGKQLETPLSNVKFSGITWLGETGFFYSSYQRPDGSVLSAEVDDHRVYFHRLTTSQSQDERIFGGQPNQQYRYANASITEDQRFLSISAAQTTAGNRLLIRDLSRPDRGFISIVADVDSDTYVVDNAGDKLLLYTNHQAPNGRLVALTLDRPHPDQWQTVIAETNQPLSIATGAGYLFARYLIDAQSRLFQYDYQGNLVRELPLPEPGSASLPRGKRDDDILYYSFSNYKQPRSIFSLAPKTGISTRFFKPEVQFDPTDYQTQQVFYTSRDGTRIPMTITHRAGITLDGQNPLLLYGYGGFDISITPGFSASTALWLQLGGVYAVPNIRGGGEYGKSWHLQGTQHQKQNVFDDFIAAAEFLIAKGYTQPDYLAIQGRSNGGLLVGAVMTQRPDLMRVALPAVGVLDMLRYHTFTAGAGWAFDYGRSDESEAMFKTLLSYSPLHNLKQGVTYPATLITTGDHDDRVVPSHSYKFAASLQRAQSGAAPTLIRVATNTGHGAGTAVAKRIDEIVDLYSFTLSNMGIDRLETRHAE